MALEFTAEERCRLTAASVTGALGAEKDEIVVGAGSCGKCGRWRSDGMWGFGWWGLRWKGNVETLCWQGGGREERCCCCRSLIDVVGDQVRNGGRGDIIDQSKCRKEEDSCCGDRLIRVWGFGEWHVRCREHEFLKSKR